MSSAHSLAAGLRVPPALSQSFAATQAAWRFFNNERVDLPMLAGPWITLARQEVPVCCRKYLLVALDWSHLHYETHASKKDRKLIGRSGNYGYKLLTALGLSDRDGQTLAPLCLELSSEAGVHSTRQPGLMDTVSALDSLTPVMKHVEDLNLGRKPVFIIDAEADSIGHYRQWQADGRLFVVRADKERRVRHDGSERTLLALGEALAGTLRISGGPIAYRGRIVRQYVGETQVTLDRPARRHRVHGRTRRRENVPGPAIVLRLVIAELRDKSGRTVARWFLLTKVAVEDADAACIARWYLDRWRIEDCHKLLKNGGHHVESWLQQTAEALAKRLCVALMALSVVWQLARQHTPQAAQFREVLVRLSGRQIKRGKNQPTFTVPALLAGMGVLLPMLGLLQTIDPRTLLDLAKSAMPVLRESG